MTTRCVLGKCPWITTTQRRRLQRRNRTIIRRLRPPLRLSQPLKGERDLRGPRVIEGPNPRLRNSPLATASIITVFRDASRVAPPDTDDGVVNKAKTAPKVTRIATIIMNIITAVPGGQSRRANGRKSLRRRQPTHRKSAVNLRHLDPTRRMSPQKWLRPQRPLRKLQ